MNSIRFWFALLRSAFQRQVVTDRVSRQPGGGDLSNLRLLQPYLRRHGKRFSLGVVLVLLTALLAFPGPLVYRFLVDDVILAKRLDMLLWAILALVGLKLVTTMVSLAESFLFSRLQMDITLDLQTNLLQHTLSLPKAFFDDKEVGYLMSRLTLDTQGLTWFFSRMPVNILSNVIRLIGGVIFLFILEWRLALLSSLILPVLVVVVRYFSGHLRRLSHQNMEQNARVFTRFQETLSSLPLIKAFTTETQETERVADQVKASQQVSLEQSVLGSVIGTIFNLVPDLARFFVLVGGAYWIITGEWTLGSLLAFQSYLGYIFSPALSLAYTNNEIQTALASLDRVSAILKVTPENSGKGISVQRLDGSVRFEHVDFSYSDSDPVLEDIDFGVNPGEHVAVVGPSGVGKTTLISLLLRFYHPTRGRIIYDNREAGEYDLPSLRQRIGYVSQSTLLMEGTLRDNLSYGNPGASEEELLHAAQVAGILDFIKSLPNGLDSLVGEKGVNLSEGQKQRLSIARALVKDPDIIILDEPTSALDSLVERSIFDSLPTEVKGKTLFIAAHRLSTIQKADRILVLKDKKLIAVGTHFELMSTNEYYRSLFA